MKPTMDPCLDLCSWSQTSLIGLDIFLYPSYIHEYHMDKLWQVVCFCVYVCVYYCLNRPGIVTFENEQFHQSSAHVVDRPKVKLSYMIVEWIGDESIICKTFCLRHLRKLPCQEGVGIYTTTKSQIMFDFVFFFLIFFWGWGPKGSPTEKVAGSIRALPK